MKILNKGYCVRYPNDIGVWRIQGLGLLGGLYETKKEAEQYFREHGFKDIPNAYIIKLAIIELDDE